MLLQLFFLFHPEPLHCHASGTLVNLTHKQHLQTVTDKKMLPTNWKLQKDYCCVQAAQKGVCLSVKLFKLKIPFQSKTYCFGRRQVQEPPRLKPANDKKNVCRSQGEPYKLLNVVPTPKHGGGGIMLWG